MESIGQWRPVRPARPAAAYLGGKRHLAQRLVTAIEQVPHQTYAEPFVGMGGVFLRRRRAPACEVVNDYSRDVATFFRVLQRHFVAFLDMLKFQVTTRTEFERLIATDPVTLTDLERAARFLYLQRLAYGGKVAGRNFGTSPGTPARFDVTRLHPLLEELHERLAGVVIECLPWSEFITRYDTAETLFYLDPPYYGCETDYGPIFDRREFSAMAAQLADIAGGFVLSLNDHEAVRDIFAEFPMQQVETTYTVAGGEGKRVSELIITSANATVALSSPQATLW